MQFVETKIEMNTLSCSKGNCGHLYKLLCNTDGKIIKSALGREVWSEKASEKG